MRTMLLTIALTFGGAAPLAAQNFVTNGDFANGLTGWTETGYSCASAIETFDVTGLGSSPCYATSPGGQTTPAPYPPNTLEQQVLVIPGVPLEFTADVHVDRPVQVSNADAGSYTVEVGGQQILSLSLGSFVSGQPQRARLCARFVTMLSGMQTLKVTFHRAFLCANNTPRTRIDNISLQIAQGPTFCMVGNRKLGKTVSVQALGAAGAPFAFFLSPRRTGGVPIPGIGGTLYLDPVALAFFFGGTTNAQGVYSLSLTIPNDQYLLFAPTWVQGVMLSGGNAALGFDQVLTFVQ